MGFVRADLERGIIVESSGVERSAGDKKEKQKEDVLFRFSLNGVRIESEKAAISLTWFQTIRILIQANFYMGCMLKDEERV